MNSTKQAGQAAVRLIRTVALRAWAVVLLILQFMIGLFALGGLGDLLVTGKNLPPVKVIFFPHETQVCLALAIIWAAWKVRSFLRARSLQGVE